ncbi:MAG: hypothetical protein GQ544_02490 [Candidatus Aminicenantes bacterium]|nr:hypothetical protein [Candidatus Aminicenantes bacterium]
MNKIIKSAAKIGLIAVLLAAFTLPVSAQNNSSVFGWDISFPLGGTKDFIASSSTSFRGFSFEYRRFVREQVAVSFYFGWHAMNGEAISTVELGKDEEGYDGHLTGKHWNYINSFPIMVGAHYYLGSRGGLHASVGINGGLMAVEERLEVNVLAFQSTKWGFGFAPEVGIFFPVTPDVNAYAGAKYHYSLTSSSGIAAGLNESINHNYFTLSIGVSFDYGYF